MWPRGASSRFESVEAGPRVSAQHASSLPSVVRRAATQSRRLHFRHGNRAAALAARKEMPPPSISEVVHCPACKLHLAQRVCGIQTDLYLASRVMGIEAWGLRMRHHRQGMLRHQATMTRLSSVDLDSRDSHANLVTLAYKPVVLGGRGLLWKEAILIESRQYLSLSYSASDRWKETKRENKGVCEPPKARHPMSRYMYCCAA